MPFYLLPNVFSDEQAVDKLLPIGLDTLCESLDGFIAESERTARRYLLKVTHSNPKMRTIPIYLLNEHASLQEIKGLEERIIRGETLGMISDAGLSCIADPGSNLILRLRNRGYNPIEAIPGPSSIFLALMLSGLSGQKFSFHGYLPKEEEERKNALKKMELESYKELKTEIWIETPYRNRAMYKSALETLHPKTVFSIASQLTFPQQNVQTRSIEQWRRIEKEGKYTIDSVPTVFLIQKIE